MKDLMLIIIGLLLTAAAAIATIAPAMDSYEAGANQIAETQAVMQPQFEQLNQLTAEMEK